MAGSFILIIFVTITSCHFEAQPAPTAMPFQNAEACDNALKALANLSKKTGIPLSALCLPTKI